MPGSIKHPIPQVQLALEKYCGWLNANALANGEDHTFMPSEFFTGYGYLEIEFLKIDKGFFDAVLVMQVNNGDEGGGARLFVEFFQNQVLNMVQSFDSAIGAIVSDGKLVNVEGY